MCSKESGLGREGTGEGTGAVGTWRRDFWNRLAVFKYLKGRHGARD